MKVLVTGASGFIGSALCDSLLVRGETVVALTRDPRRARRTNPRVEWHAWEPTLERPPAQAFEGVDAVVNLLGEKINQRWTEEAKRRIMESRRTGTHNLVGTISALQHKPRVLVSQSAIGYYGDRGDEELTEASTPGTDFLSDVVQAWESAAKPAVDAGASVVFLRTGIVMAPEGGAMKPMLRLVRYGVGGPLGSGRQFMPWITLPDEIGAILHLLDRPDVTGPVNLTAGQPARQKEIAKALGRVLHRPAVLPAPSFALRAAIGGFASEVLGGQRITGDRLRESGYELIHGDLDTAIRWLVA